MWKGRWGPRSLDRAIVGRDGFRGSAGDEEVGDGNSEALDPLHRFILGVCERFAELTPAVSEEAKRARRGDAGVLLAERAGGGVARVGEDLAARRFLPFVQRLEV